MGIITYLYKEVNMLTSILAISVIVWYVTDRFKKFWDGFSWSGYVTMGFVAALGAASVFSFGLDLLVALEIHAEISIVGQLLTVLSLMTGSSAIAEIIERVKGGSDLEHYD